ncbi:MAG: ribosome-associated translation inhibitor RaiA [Pseudoxanthomonas suwonensis]|nr:ribosome-associated translation inhibitor RaiA [Pseudoxanthomonas suwonensis]
MRVEIHGQQMDVTPALHDYVTGKLRRLQRHFGGESDIRVQIAQDKPAFKAEATVNVPGHKLHTEAVAHDMYAAIDQLADKLDRLLLKHKGKHVVQQRGIGLARGSQSG